MTRATANSSEKGRNIDSLAKREVRIDHCVKSQKNLMMKDDDDDAWDSEQVKLRIVGNDRSLAYNGFHGALARTVSIFDPNLFRAPILHRESKYWKSGISSPDLASDGRVCLISDTPSRFRNASIPVSLCFY